MKPRRPLLRYHGGKWKDSKWIISHFPAHDKYVEPFGGAASILLNKNRSRFEVYNELNEEITTLFKVVRDHCEELSEKVALTPYSHSEFKLSYELTDCIIESARRTLVRSFMGFGLCVTARKKAGFRRFSRSRGASPNREWDNIPENLMLISERLKGVLIEDCMPAIECMKKQDSDSTLHYLDPPYHHDTRHDKSMYLFEMNESQHIDLAEEVHVLNGMVVISGYAHPLYDNELFVGWERITKQSWADGAKEREEVLWINESASQQKRSNQLELNLT